MSDWLPGPGWLFCPGDRPDRYRKALENADVVILDLEDAVAPERKEFARNALHAMGEQGVLALDRTVVRVNAADSVEHARDLETVNETGILQVMLAKAEHPSEVKAVERDVIALIETPRGVEWAGALAEPSNVIGLMWGADDLVAGLGGTTSRHGDGTYRDVARYARSRTLIAAKACDRLALDGVHMDIADVEGLRAACLDGAAVGFDATVAIHPSQVPVIRAAYSPTDQQVDWARRLLDEVGAERGVTTFEGRMVDAPVYRQAERVLQRASTTRSGSHG